jgi:hypothetical protein
VPFSDSTPSNLVSGRKPFEEATPSRLDSRFITAVGSLLAGNIETKTETLQALPARGVLPGGTGKAADPAVTKSIAAGIASPLKEGLPAAQETVQRTYWPAEVVMSSDGLLAFEYEPIKTLKMTDAQGALVEFRFQKEP